MLRLVEAVGRTLELQPAVRFQQEELEGAYGDLSAARGQFDAVLSSSFGRFRDESPLSAGEAAAIGQTSTVSQLTSYGVGYRKQLRSGLLLSPSVELNRASRNISPGTANSADFSLNVTQPLLRGRGRDVVAVNERVGEIGVGAAGLDLRQVRSQSALDTIVAYWNYVFAVRQLAVFTDSENRSRELEAQVQALIDADSRPAADIKQMRANRIDRASLRVGAEQRLVQARYALGIRMGLAYEGIGSLPLPSDEFPSLSELEVPSEDVLIAEALSRRLDLRSTEERERQARALVRAAENGLQPRLDLVFTGGYNGLVEGTSFRDFFSPFEAVAGPSASLRLVYEWAGANQFANGLLLRRRSTLQQSAIQTEEVARNIRANVAVARNDLLASAEQVESSRSAADLYRSAIADERVKQQLGTSTVIDLIVTEDRLTASLLDELSAALGYASAVARLRFETGTLLEDAGGTETVMLENLTTIPFTEARPR